MILRVNFPSFSAGGTSCSFAVADGQAVGAECGGFTGGHSTARHQLRLLVAGSRSQGGRVFVVVCRDCVTYQPSRGEGGHGAWRESESDCVSHLGVCMPFSQVDGVQTLDRQQIGGTEVRFSGLERAETSPRVHACRAYRFASHCHGRLQRLVVRWGAGGRCISLYFRRPSAVGRLSWALALPSSGY